MTMKERLINIDQKHLRLIPKVLYASDLLFALCGAAGAAMFLFGVIKGATHHIAITCTGIALVILSFAYLVSFRLGACVAVQDMLNDHRKKQEASKNFKLDCLQGQKYVNPNQRKRSDSSNKSLECSDFQTLLKSPDSAKRSKLR